MPLAASRVFKQFKYAMYFDGVDDYVLVPDERSLRPSAFTIFVFAWMSAPSQYQLQLFMKSGNAPGYTMTLEVNAPAYGSNVRYLISDVSSGAYYNKLYKGGVSQWFAPALVYDGSKAYSYYNGALVASDSLSYDNTKNTNPIKIGFPFGTNPPDLISLVLYYSRPLSDSEIQQNCNYPDNPVRNGLVLWLKADPAYVKDINNDGILEWIDLSGFNNHGKIYGPQLVQLIKGASRVVQAQRVLPCAR